MRSLNASRGDFAVFFASVANRPILRTGARPATPGSRLAVAYPGRRWRWGGKDAIRAWLEPDVFAEARLEPLEFAENDDSVLMRSRFHARGAASGIELDVESYAVDRVRDGLAWRVENWARREDAERAAGLSLS